MSGGDSEGEAPPGGSSLPSRWSPPYNPASSPFISTLSDESFPGGSVVKNLLAIAGDAGDVGSIPGWEGSLEEEMVIHPQYSCLENSMDRGAWWATVPGVQSDGRNCVTEHEYMLCLTNQSKPQISTF